MIQHLAAATMTLLLLLGGVAPLRAEDVKAVTIYPSDGYRVVAQWAIPLRLWVHKPRSLTTDLITHLVARPETRSAAEIARAHDRLSDLVADDASGEQVVLGFDEDPRQMAYQLLDARGRPLTSDLNGLVEGTLRLDVARAEALLRAQGSTQGWLRLHARSPGHQGEGRVRLLASQGRSVISDIDDTLKITGIPAGREVVLENTFFRPFVAAPGMAQRYRALGAATAFHYVSGSPWGLYRPLADFISAAGYPAGSFHLKNVRKNLLTAGAWQDLARLAGGEATQAQKRAQIGAIIGQFPARRFILVGDSGEQDPEIYRAIRQRFPRQIEAIWIRDVVDDRHRHPARLAGVTSLP
ncbi:App1 family protein [Thiorhodococcus mannitoliphagus]|uniref:App1 family protein n=1 Tax=Thiorhodococcus mannitoliphagus TaxID=329406 RepID=A0A6P1DUL6_9GAMM|nr:App1 family protein [Thiorhodococcus mannitoliphagus]NEX21788.1 App1 family protein [Thiorhodococcus mannitoliphagus]